MNIYMSEQAETQTQPAQTETKEVNVVDVDIKDENTALNVMVALLNTAQRRGVYTMQESAQAWNCVKMFMRRNDSTEVKSA